MEEGQFSRFPSASCGVSLNGKVFDYFCIFINFISFHLLSLIFKFEARFRDVEIWTVCLFLLARGGIFGPVIVGSKQEGE